MHNNMLYHGFMRITMEDAVRGFTAVLSKSMGHEAICLTLEHVLTDSRDELSVTAGRRNDTVAA
jgi:hypothetical protein